MRDTHGRKATLSASGEGPQRVSSVVVMKANGLVGRGCSSSRAFLFIWSKILCACFGTLWNWQTLRAKLRSSTQRLTNAKSRHKTIEVTSLALEVICSLYPKKIPECNHFVVWACCGQHIIVYGIPPLSPKIPNRTFLLSNLSFLAIAEAEPSKRAPKRRKCNDNLCVEHVPEG